jgi:hypothetical protein
MAKGRRGAGFMHGVNEVKERVARTLRACERRQFCSYVRCRQQHAAESSAPYPPFHWGAVRAPLGRR